MVLLTRPLRKKPRALWLSVWCNASAKDVVEFNTTLNNSKTTLINADKFSPWGGTAWKIELPIFIEDISSKIVIMNGRRSFYLRVPASHPEKIIPILANQFQLTSISTDMTHLVVGHLKQELYIYSWEKIPVATGLVVFTTKMQLVKPRKLWSRLLHPISSGSSVYCVSWICSNFRYRCLSAQGLTVNGLSWQT